MPPRGPSPIVSNEGIRLVVIHNWEHNKPTQEMIAMEKASKIPHPMDEPKTRSAFVLKDMSRQALIRFGEHVKSCGYCISLLYEDIRPRPPLVPINPLKPTKRKKLRDKISPAEAE